MAKNAKIGDYVTHGKETWKLNAELPGGKYRLVSLDGERTTVVRKLPKAGKAPEIPADVQTQLDELETAYTSLKDAVLELDPEAPSLKDSVVEIQESLKNK